MDYLKMVSRLGIGSAHPGGFVATIEQLEKYKPAVNGTVLEIGCGTGRTACYLAEQGYQVIATDLDPHVLLKARKRAAAMGVHVDFVQADAHALPFQDNTFQTILVESVTNFTQAKTSVSEYFRVLKQDGVLYDREMFIRSSAPAERLVELKTFFQMPALMKKEEWSSLLEDCGFSQIQLLEMNEVQDDKLKQQYECPDNYQYIDEGSLLDASVLECGMQSSNMIMDHKEYLEYGTIRAVKNTEDHMDTQENNNILG
ncbi:methyltransferase domain-containing protein [Paenibacillus sp. SN-8-1]|uniref:class I SAM-dependent methyltransferase n=1 Tax=Paenibacillus sp. SN-8-1 TaxID=3435409 RepID=UPI003D9A9A1D